MIIAALLLAAQTVPSHGTVYGHLPDGQQCFYFDSISASTVMGTTMPICPDGIQWDYMHLGAQWIDKDLCICERTVSGVVCSAGDNLTLLAGMGQNAPVQVPSLPIGGMYAECDLTAGPTCYPPQNVSIKHLAHAQLLTCREEAYGEMRCEITPDPNPPKRKHRHIVLKIVTAPLIPVFWLLDLGQSSVP